MYQYKHIYRDKNKFELNHYVVLIFSEYHIDSPSKGWGRNASQQLDKVMSRLLLLKLLNDTLAGHFRTRKREYAPLLEHFLKIK
tara:strand:+ start:8616 stop:8867 length:252 start_codon:yes stop_codon:yes gene_type:complete